MRFMTDTQCAYVVGRNPQLPLGGVDCHAYFEFKCGKLKEASLAEAWRNLFEIHRDMRAFYSDGAIIASDELPASATLKVIDLRGYGKYEKEEFLRNFRRKQESRKYTAAERDYSSLWLIKTSNEENLLAFDWNLVVGDVKSFVIVLEQLSQIYRGISIERNAYDTETLILRRRKKAIADKSIAEAIIKEDIYKCSATINLQKLKEDNSLSGCRYKSIDRYVSAGNFVFDEFADSRLMSAFALALCELTGDEGTFINYPCFMRSEEEEGCVGDFTDIKIIPIKNDSEESKVRNYEHALATCKRHMQYSGYNAAKVRRMIGKAHPEAGSIAPVVFSPLVDRELLTEEFEKSIGTLAYMASQTPQVWLDVQTFKMKDKLYVSIVYPEDMFEKKYVRRLADNYIANIEELLK